MDVRGNSGSRLVVVGHGPTGHHLVEALRERDTVGGWQITVIGEEIRPAYDRVALTSYLTEDADLGYPAHGPDVTLLTGDPVVAIDRTSRTVTTGSGATIGYDALVLATGSAPFVPPVQGKELPGVFVYRTIEDRFRHPQVPGRGPCGGGTALTSSPIQDRECPAAPTVWMVRAVVHGSQARPTPHLPARSPPARRRPYVTKCNRGHRQRGAIIHECRG
jgi:NADPH-dependent 2,4-dienoyl-CoA reductase/sulfur reductase-like enzyme